MTDKTAAAQAVRTWPTPGDCVRITRTHTSGIVETVEGVASDGGWDEDRANYWLMLGEGAMEVALTSVDAWSVAWEVLTPPTPTLPPEPEMGAVVVGRDGEVWQRATTGDRGWMSIGGGVWFSWVELNEEYGPFTRLVPASSDPGLLTELAEALRGVTKQLVVYARAHCEQFHPDEDPGVACAQYECRTDAETAVAVAALLARVEATNGGAAC